LATACSSGLPDQPMRDAGEDADQAGDGEHIRRKDRLAVLSAAQGEVLPCRCGAADGDAAAAPRDGVRRFRALVVDLDEVRVEIFSYSGRVLIKSRPFDMSA